MKTRKQKQTQPYTSKAKANPALYLGLFTYLGHYQVFSLEYQGLLQT